ncbi:UDP-N-acetylmuramoyl-L-alanyl-D-glutamate--2,6-diaminopimelate ligase [Bacillus sp. CGMCC 1.16541]|uniref:UDP-N-acetylmuramoyl-L-alanyl-D-glutamate--2, 6-diaminopimelate ligase n=1 Tax=Bacillus sp. CGMCC 1.16541 TaxID=2185143 RepID=UPI0013A52BAB|nr:UDP-N-acetylmuramoyl-L-alanyl-D-glutamate--2,6-diaminopimelate ligase [Bacillus sp. CGMCC 1.16541]
MKLHHILQGIQSEQRLDDIENIDIHTISFNSKQLTTGDLFVAISGGTHDGHTYIHQAIEAGAAAIVGEKALTTPLSVPYIQVTDSRQALATLAVNYYNHPAKKHIMIGITGTNGKTTTAFMLKHLLECEGYTCSLLGSVMNIINGEEIQATATTPDSLELNRLLHLSNDQVVIMEVSSHALTQARVAEIEFDYCLFTNLGHDHLDYHQTFDDYFAAKASLFHQLASHGHAIVNIDNEWGEKLHHLLLSKHKNVLSLSTHKDAKWKLTIQSMNRSSHVTLLNEREEALHFELRFPGEHNVYNCSMALMTGTAMGIAHKNLSASTPLFKGVPGRFTMIEHEGKTIVIDYAHTTDAFEHCLQTAKQCGAKQIYHVFGFRDGRDESKRGKMIETSAALATKYVLTLDDVKEPAKEDMMLTLMTLHYEHGSHNGEVVPDRTKAIEQAINQASDGDWIVITGKGHESYKQTFELGTHSDLDTVLTLTTRDEEKEDDIVI